MQIKLRSISRKVYFVLHGCRQLVLKYVEFGFYKRAQSYTIVCWRTLFDQHYLEPFMNNLKYDS